MNKLISPTNPRRKVLLEKLLNWLKSSPPFTDPKGLFPRSEETTTGPHLEEAESSPHIHNILP
jgi:hypothetical protein